MLTASRLAEYVGLSPYVTPKLVWQLYTGKVTDNREDFAAARHGIRLEPIIRRMYERMYGYTVQAAGYCIHPTIPFVGATPDGLVGEAGLVEIKAPVHNLYGRIPRQYMAQMQGQMEVFGRSWCDFVCYCARTNQISVHSVSRSREYWSWMQPLLFEFQSCVTEDRCPTSLTWPPETPPPEVPCRLLYDGPVSWEWREEGGWQPFGHATRPWGVV
uniref:YqaJ viral recombinase domain-containing protein n=1 Tax=Hemiselmis andersenii TaxID=464988 RepID=A0A7S1HL93_HEMAN